MVRVRVVLDNVRCRDTEDVTGADEFYLLGSVTDGDPNRPGPVLTRPMGINDGQTKELGVGAGTVFDADVPEDRIVKVGLVALDEDSSKDWSKHGEAITKIGTQVSAGLKLIPNPYTAAASMVLPFAVAGMGLVMSLDKDDELGQHLREFPVWAWPNGEHVQTWNMKRGGWYSGWNYTVGYRFIKG